MVFHINIFENFLRHNDINEYLDYLAETYPNLVMVSTIGYSYEGRQLKSIKISYNNELSISKKSSITSAQQNKSTTSSALTNSKTIVNSKKNEKKIRKIVSPKYNKTKNILNKRCNGDKCTVLIDGGLHAREWISIATALYCIYQLTEKYQRNITLLRNIDFVILPVVNVDGYEYTHTNNRLWRKTRKPIDGCQYTGADCNRNFSINWQNGCDKPYKNTFRGSEPFSEPETQILKNLMHSLMPNCRLYLSLHSYAKSFLYPWGYTKILPGNWKKLQRLVEIGAGAIKAKTGTKYRYGNIALSIQHTASGGSPDYAMHTVKIPFAIVMEISGGGYGFCPPATEIYGLAKESWIGIRAILRHILNQ